MKYRTPNPSGLLVSPIEGRTKNREALIKVQLRLTKRLVPSFKGTEHFPSLHNLPPHKYGSSIITKKYNGKKCMYQTLRSLSGNPKDKRQKDTRGNFSF